MLEYLWSGEVLGLCYGAVSRLETTSLVRDAYIRDSRRCLTIYRRKKDPSLLILEQDRQVYRIWSPEPILSLSVNGYILTVLTVSLNTYSLGLGYLKGRYLELRYHKSLTFETRLQYL